MDSSTTPLCVGIDIGKNVHCYGGYAGGELQLIKPRQEVRNNQPGYETFQRWLQLHSGQYGPIRVGLEPTGVYHEAWAYAIQQDFGDQIDFRFLNPYQTRQKRRQLHNGRKKKTAPIDVEAIAHCLRDGQGNPACLSRPETIRFDLWAAEFRHAYPEHQRLQLCILTQWDRLWPGVCLCILRDPGGGAPCISGGWIARHIRRYSGSEMSGVQEDLYGLAEYHPVRLKPHSETVESILWLVGLGVDASALEEVYRVREMTIRTWLC